MRALRLRPAGNRPRRHAIESALDVIAMVRCRRRVSIETLSALCSIMGTGREAKSTLLVSSKGQIVLPAALRRRLGLSAGARLQVVERADGLTLRVVRSVPRADVASLAGMLKAPTRGVPRRLEDFDAATLVARGRKQRS